MYIMVDMLLDVVITGRHITAEGDMAMVEGDMAMVEGGMAMVEGGVVGTCLSNSI